MLKYHYDNKSKRNALPKQNLIIYTLKKNVNNDFTKKMKYNDGKNSINLILDMLEYHFDNSYSRMILIYYMDQLPQIEITKILQY